MNRTDLRHNQLQLALWELRSGRGRPLLLLHGLGERTTPEAADAVEAWPGPVFGLDFTGHGGSSVPAGGGYYCEILMADVDTALAVLDPESTGRPGVTVLGRGLGGYVALLIAGARPDIVRGAIIADGPGLHGGGPGPTSPMLWRPEQDGATPDPVALVELATDVRPPDYARTFAWQASALSGLETAIAVAAVNRPPWLAEVAAQPGVVEADLDTALALYAT
ncbi:MAG: alpha/beta hydrolase [Acidimicrobiia bacterium]